MNLIIVEVVVNVKCVSDNNCEVHDDDDNENMDLMEILGSTM